MKFTLVSLFLSLGGLTLASSATSQEAPEAVVGAEEEGLEDESGLENWEAEGGDEDFSALIDDTHGIGFGLTSASLPGWMIYYDYNQPQWVFDDKRAQFHYQMSMVGETDDDTAGKKIVRARQMQFTATARLLNVQGVYVGAGLGVQETNLTYIPTGMDHKGSSIFGLFEGGWQGDDGFYLQLGIRPAFHITKSPTVNTSVIPEANGHKKAVNRVWRWSQELSGVILGFGWYLS